MGKIVVKLSFFLFFFVFFFSNRTHFPSRTDDLANSVYRSFNSRNSSGGIFEVDGFPFPTVTISISVTATDNFFNSFFFFFFFFFFLTDVPISNQIQIFQRHCLQTHVLKCWKRDWIV